MVDRSYKNPGTRYKAEVPPHKNTSDYEAFGTGKKGTYITTNGTTYTEQYSTLAPTYERTIPKTNRTNSMASQFVLGRQPMSIFFLNIYNRL